MTAPTTTGRYARITEHGVYIHEATAEGEPANRNGVCIAFARRRLADGRWEVRDVIARRTVGEYRNRRDALDKLRAMTGAVIS